VLGILKKLIACAVSSLCQLGSVPVPFTAVAVNKPNGVCSLVPILEVLTALNIQVEDFWVVTQYQLFGGPCCFTSDSS